VRAPPRGAALSWRAARRRARCVREPSHGFRGRPTRPTLRFAYNLYTLEPNVGPIIPIQAAGQPYAYRRFPMVNPFHGRSKLRLALPLRGLARWTCWGHAHDLRPRPLPMASLAVRILPHTEVQICCNLSYKTVKFAVTGAWKEKRRSWCMYVVFTAARQLVEGIEDRTDTCGSSTPISRPRRSKGCTSITSTSHRGKHVLLSNKTRNCILRRVQ
jgi:hypothetical protein